VRAIHVSSVTPPVTAAAAGEQTVLSESSRRGSVIRAGDAAYGRFPGRPLFPKRHPPVFSLLFAFKEII
jgi:hypothetical protein